MAFWLFSVALASVCDGYSTGFFALIISFFGVFISHLWLEIPFFKCSRPCSRCSGIYNVYFCVMLSGAKGFGKCLQVVWGDASKLAAHFAMPCFRCFDCNMCSVSFSELACMKFWFGYVNLSKRLELGFSLYMRFLPSFYEYKVCYGYEYGAYVFMLSFQFHKMQKDIPNFG